jgi:hypothetical protein
MKRRRIVGGGDEGGYGYRVGGGYVRATGEKSGLAVPGYRGGWKGAWGVGAFDVLRSDVFRERGRSEALVLCVRSSSHIVAGVADRGGRYRSDGAV